MNSEINDEVDVPAYDVDKRENSRISKTLGARFKNKKCSVLNISNKGILLETEMAIYHFPIEDTILFELEIDGQWMSLLGIIQWTASYPLYNRVGLFIRNAPDLYLDFLKGLYE